MKEKILIIEDEQDIAKLLEFNLSKEGYTLEIANTGIDGLNKTQNFKPDLILLDLMLPEKDGFEVCKELRAKPETINIPIIILSAKSQELDKVLGLELGADDYVTKPFSNRELLARIKAVLRRKTSKPEIKDEILIFGKLSINLAKVEVKIDKKIIELTAKEYELLKTLIEAKGRVLSRDYLLENIWGFDKAGDIFTRTVDVHIRTLRQKLGSEADRVLTVRNYGYRFVFEN